MNAREAAETLFEIAGPEWDQIFSRLSDERAWSELSRGVYVLWLDGAAHYVGQSTCIPSRLKTHRRTFIADMKCSVLVPTEPVASMLRLREMEGRLIRSLRPPNNISKGMPEPSKYGADVRKQLVALGRDHAWLAKAVGVSYALLTNWLTKRSNEEVTYFEFDNIPKLISKVLRAETAAQRAGIRTETPPEPLRRIATP